MAWKYSHRRAAPFFSNETKMSCWHGVFRSFSHAKSKVTKKKKKVRISAATQSQPGAEPLAGTSKATPAHTNVRL